MISHPLRKNKKKKRNSFPVKKHVINGIIAILVLFVLGFMWSFIDNLTNDNKIQMDKSESLADLLIINEYEKVTGHRIRIEVLNGCGARGLADKYTNLFRKKGFDVILSGNAGHFNYPETEVILRRGDRSLAVEVASVLEIPSENIVEDYDDLLDCDVTVVIGKDFENSPSFDEALKYSPPF